MAPHCYAWSQVKRLLSLFLAGVCPLLGQFSNLATTDDGRVLYFSSPLRLRGTEQFPHDKIFQRTGEEFHLVAQLERILSFEFVTNFFRLIDPDVSGDGRVVSYVGQRNCFGGSRCVFVGRFLSTVKLPEVDEPLILLGRVQLSRNGRYAVQFRSGLPESNRIDLVTGDRIEIPQRFWITARQAITSDGSIAVQGQTGLSLWTPDGTTPIPIEGEHLRSAIINDQGDWVIYESFPPRQLRSIELEERRDTLLAEGAVEFYQPSISNDGSLVLYVGPAPGSDTNPAPTADPETTQAFLVKPDGTERRQVTDAPEGVSEAILSGSGDTVYAATYAGRLLHIDVTTGTTREVIPRSPFIDAVKGGAAPGSLNFIHGTGLSETIAVADPPLPESLGGVEVRLGGVPARVLLVSATDVRFQIPFEMKIGDVPVEISSPESPFEQVPVLLPVSAQMPRFIRSGEVATPGADDFQAVIVDSDFSSLITHDNPARPADVVTLYMTGLGATEPPVPTGEVTPLAPLSFPIAPIECVWLDDVERPIETFFAGLAPVLIGVYQLTVRLPADPRPFFTDPSRAGVSLKCGVLGSQTDSAGVPVRLSELAN